ncbi:MAG: hypothetical protein IKJ45_06640, partial [Kiritimatiellae bacterium]|nr:hypothetical protein [Kiritimatiellia bacterium]
ACPSIFHRTSIYIYRPHHPYNAQPARCLLKGLSLQEPTEIIQLIKHPPTLFNLSHFFKWYDPRFSKDPTPDVPTPDVPTKSPGAPLPMV